MNEINTTTGLETEENILNYTVSDEAIEAAAGIEKGAFINTVVRTNNGDWHPMCCS